MLMGYLVATSVLVVAFGRIGDMLGRVRMYNAGFAVFTDAFPVEQRGTAMGINQVAGIAGSFIGLLVGGLLADTDWRLVFWVSVPFGVFGTVWAYLKLREVRRRAPARLDWWGN